MPPRVRAGDRALTGSVPVRSEPATATAGAGRRCDPRRLRRGGAALRSARAAPDRAPPLRVGNSRLPHRRAAGRPATEPRHAASTERGGRRRGGRGRRDARGPRREGRPSPAADDVVRRNVRTIAELEESARRQRTPSQRIADAITAAAGNPLFACGHGLVFALWIAVNLLPIPACGSTPFRSGSSRWSDRSRRCSWRSSSDLPGPRGADGRAAPPP
jgi:hypothetical protein